MSFVSPRSSPAETPDGRPHEATSLHGDENAFAVSFPAALLDGRIVWADDFARTRTRPKGCLCIGCKGRMILRVGKRTPHFAHHDTPCSSDEALHRAMLLVLYRELKRRMKNGGPPLPIAHGCRFCRAWRAGNLAKQVGGSVDVRRPFGDHARPDLLVRDKSGRARFVVEIIVLSEPEREAMLAYIAARIPVIRIWPEWKNVKTIPRVGLTREDYQQRRDDPRLYDIVGPCYLPDHGKPRPREAAPSERRTRSRPA